MPKVDKNNWAKTLKNIVLHLKIVRGMRGMPLAFVVWHHVPISPLDIVPT